MTSPDEMRQTANATILIVEDNDDIRQLLVTVLSPYFHTITAVDGREGLEVTRDVMPDIIISDVLMPHLSGLELCKMIKEDLSICHIPVILLTAQTALNQELEGLKIGLIPDVYFNTNLVNILTPKQTCWPLIRLTKQC